MDSFDTSWIEESERMCSIETNLLREKLSSIPMMFIYINENSVIDSIDKEILLLPELSSGLSHLIPKEKLLKLVKTKQKKTVSSKYILKDILLFHIPLEPEQISSFTNGGIEVSESSFLHTYPIIEDILLPPSLFIFHSINCIYFFYHEISDKSNSTHSYSKKYPIKSILKSELKTELKSELKTELKSEKNIKKKTVKIYIPNEKQKRMTRKNTILL